MTDRSRDWSRPGAGWVPAGIDVDRPSAARVYDFYLGGSHNFAVDREMARQAVAMWPDLPLIMRANRAFLRRAVRFLAGQGVTQFVDLGSGIPTVGNVHEVAQGVDPTSRVVYVDIDPVAVAHSRAILAGDDRATAIVADLCDVDAVWSDPDLRRLIDPRQPVGVLMVAVLHFVSDAADPWSVTRRYRSRLGQTGFLAISHATFEGEPDQAGPHVALYRQTPTPMTMRSRSQVAALFDGWELVDPGLVYLPQWRPLPGETPTEHPQRFSGLAGVGRAL
jgi:S-adenosyl methyltransferase